MKRDRIAFSVLAFIAMLMVLAVPAAATDNVLYFNPDNSSVSGYCSSVDVQVMADISESNPASATAITITFDPSCVDITNWALDSGWNSGTDSWSTGSLQITTAVGANPPVSGSVPIGMLTLHCNDTDGCCGSWLNFTTAEYTNASDMATIVAATDDGTFICGDGIEITKTVWDGSDWVDALGPLPSSWYGQEVTFNITVAAGCMSLSNLMIVDTMSDSLAYVDNSSIIVPNPLGFNAEPTPTGPNTYMWFIPFGAGPPPLAPGGTVSITFNATIVAYGTDCNVAVASAGVTDLGLVEVSAMDQACVTTMPPAGIDVNKTVWDGSAWVEEITGATIGDTYRFRCEVENIGSPGMNVCDMTVTDVLPAGLAYADNAMLQDHHGIWHSLPNPPAIYNPASNTYGWIINNTVPGECLQVGQKIVVEYDVTVTNYGLSCNDITAEAYCSAATSWVQNNDSACIDVPKPDLTVSDITVNYDASKMVNLAIGPEPPGTRTQCNNISVNITELNGVDVELGFNVMLEINGVAQACSPMHVPAVMAGGSTVTVYCDCSFRPIAGVQYNISATVDSGGAIPESNEDNNVHWRNLTAIVNGYKGDGWQDGRNISTVLPCYLQGPINLVYSPGDSYYKSGYYNFWGTYEANWIAGTTSGDLIIPSADTSIKTARLYAYYHADKTGTKWNNLSLTFNGFDMPDVAHYSDGKGFDSWDYSSDVGVLVYNVTHKIVVGGNNKAILTDNNIPGVSKGNNLTMEGMVLVVVYENPNEPNRIIWINEGCDLLKASSSYGVSAEEATTYAAFAGCEPISLNEVVGAKLISIAQIGNKGDDLNRMYFNGGEWHGLFPGGYAIGTNIGIHEADVRQYLTATDNVATYQDNGDMFAPANSFLIVTTAKGQVEVVAPDECIGVTEQFDVMINVTSVVPVYGAEYELSFNPAVIHAEWQNEGDFLKQDDATTNVYINTIDNSAGTVTFAVTRTDISTGATVPGTLATVHFTAVQMGANTTLTLTSVKVSDPDAQPLLFEKLSDNVSVCDNTAPVAAAECLFKFNNVGTKYMSKTYFNGSESSDDPDGSITNYRWYFGDGNYGAGVTYEHIYGSWNWNGGASGSYDQFEVILTVEDDGTPMMDNSTTMFVNVYIAGDANGDGEVDIFDATIVGLEWDAECVSGSWATDRKDQADLNNDCVVDIFDAVIIGANWDHTAW